MLRAGMLEATGRVRFFTEAEDATPISEFKRLEAALAGGADRAIGSRGIVDAGVCVRARRHQVVPGRLFNWTVSCLGLEGIADSQCGFNAFTAAAAEDLFHRVRTDGFGFDVELLLLAPAVGYRVVEVPVNGMDQPVGKCSVLRDGPRMLVRILKARRRLARKA